MDEIIVTTPLNLINLIDDMVSQLTTEEIIQFIIDLDMILADWEFTEELYKWAKSEHKMYKAEKKEFGL